MAQPLTHQWHEGLTATTTAYLGGGHKPWPTTVLRRASHLLVGMRTAVGVFLLTVGGLGLGIGIGGFIGFVIFAKAWGP